MHLFVKLQIKSGYVIIGNAFKWKRWNCGKHTGQRVQEYMHHIFVLLQTIKLLVLSSCHINLPDFLINLTLSFYLPSQSKLRIKSFIP